MKAPTVDKNASFIETPNGIFTAAGHWFHTTVDALQDYAGPLLVHRTLEQLLQVAELWLRSSKTVAIWIAPFILWKFGVLPTVLTCTVVYLVLSIWGPLMVALTTTPVLKLMDNVLAQALLYIAGMSWFGMNGHFALMSTGLTIFILMRWGVIDYLFQPWIKKIHARLYRVPYEDQLLKTVVVRAAMKHKVTLPELDHMERFILKKIHKK